MLNLVPGLHLVVHQDFVRVLSQARPIALRIVRERHLLRHPDGILPTLPLVVENDASDLTTLSNAGPVADKEAAALDDAILVLFQRLRVRVAGVDDRLQLRGRNGTRCDEFLRECGLIGDRWRQHRGHRRRLHQRSWVRLRSFDSDALWLVILVDAFGQFAGGLRFRNDDAGFQQFRRGRCYGEVATIRS